MIETYRVSGTLGDAYIVCLKLLAKSKANKSKKFKIELFTKHRYWWYDIQSIYNLLPNVIVELKQTINENLQELTSNCHEQSMIFFPDIKFDYSIEIEQPYIVLQAHSGKPSGFNTKKLSKYTIEYMIDYFDPVKVVIVGTDSMYKDINRCENLVCKTTIQQCMGIVDRSSGFVGPEGLMSFVALSKKKNSIIFYKEVEAVMKRIVGTPWEEYVISLIQMM